MKTRRKPTFDPQKLDELQVLEKLIACKPSPEQYVKLAHEYQLLGIGKEADRLLQLAEFFEGSQPGSTGAAPMGLLSGTATPVMIVEVIQILSRTQSSGEFVVDTPNGSFHLFFKEGFVISAISDEFPLGLESFQHALRVTSGSYYFMQKCVDHTEQIMNAHTEVLLLDAMRQADEEAYPS